MGKANDLSENKVVKTEEDYKTWHGELATYRIALAGEFIVLGILTLMAISIHKTWDWSSSGIVVFLIDAGWLFLMFILGNFTSMLHDLQSSTRDTIDCKFNPEYAAKRYTVEGYPDWRLEGIFTTRGIRTAKLELRRYRRYKKNRGKDRKQERQELETD